MNKIKAFIGCLVILLVSVFIPIGSAYADSPTLYEYKNTNQDTSTELYLLNYFAQTFTTEEAHTLEFVRLMMYREGTTILTVYVNIYATSGGLPTGASLSSGTLDTTAMTTGTGGAWYQVNMDSLQLEKDTKYAIVCYSTGTGATYNIHWMMDGTAGAYTGGSECLSTDGGISWSADTDDDYMFEVWGYEASEILDVSVFETYQESGDWLIATFYNIGGQCGVYDYPYKAVLKETSTGTEYAIWDIEQCGMRPIGLYIGSDLADTLVWGGDYTVEIYGDFGAEPNASIIITTGDWLGEDLTWLDKWVIYQAGQMSIEDGVTYIENVPIYGAVLNIEGGTIFDIGIDYLSSYRPNIFLVTTESFSMGYEDNTGDSTYADDLYTGFNTSMGTELAPILYTVGGYFGIDGRQVATIILIMVGLLMACIMEKTFGMLVIIFGVLIGVFHLYVILGFILMLTVIFVRGWFWSST